MSIAKITSMRASGIETCAPLTTRDRTSRPTWSVPNQCAALGACSRSKSWASGSNGRIHGASTATSSQKSTMTPPATASGVRNCFEMRRRPLRLVWTARTSVMPPSLSGR